MKTIEENMSPLEAMERLRAGDKVYLGEHEVTLENGVMHYPHLKRHVHPTGYVLGNNWSVCVKEVEPEVPEGYELCSRADAGRWCMWMGDRWGTWMGMPNQNTSYHAYRYSREIEEPKAEPGEGYRRLKEHEVPQEGDEFRARSGVWYTTKNVGRHQVSGLAYRRKLGGPKVPEGYELCSKEDAEQACIQAFGKGIWAPWRSVDWFKFNDSPAWYRYARKIKVNPGEGYRLLKVGEVLRASDESWKLGRGPWGQVESYNVGGEVKEAWKHPIRRKIEMVICAGADKCPLPRCVHNRPHKETPGCELPCTVYGDTSCIPVVEPDYNEMYPFIDQRDGIWSIDNPTQDDAPIELSLAVNHQDFICYVWDDNTSRDRPYRYQGDSGGLYDYYPNGTKQVTCHAVRFKKGK